MLRDEPPALYGRDRPTTEAAHPRSLSSQRRRFVEQVGLVFESVHLPRMAGRVLGALLLGPSEGLTAGELATVLQASKASISSSTRLLLQYRFVERQVDTVDRRDRFVMPPDAWRRVMEERFALVSALRDLAEIGLELVDESADPAALIEAHEMYSFLQEEWPALLARWEEQRDSRSRARGDRQ